MHFVTGGAFNGKRNWVKEQYPEALWISAYQGDSRLENTEKMDSSFVVLEGLEEWTKKLSKDYSINEARKHWRILLGKWVEWEKQSVERKVVFLGTDITKGIVPIDKDERNWRDLTGWAYQDLALRCDQVDIIWYGINKTIKGKEIG